MDAEYKKAAEKLLCGITDKRLHEPQYGTIFFLLSVQVNCGFGKSTMKFCVSNISAKKKSNAHLPLPKAIKAACGSMI